MTGRVETERRLAAQLTLTGLLGRDEPFDHTSRQIMQAICENLGWDVGALWEVRRDKIRCVDHWHAPMVDPDAADALCDRGGELSRGVGLIGEVWARGEAIWVPRFRDAGRFPRAPIAERAGMTAAFAFPITTRGRVVGAMEFFSAREREPDQALMPIMILIGAQIGDFMERHRTQQALRASEERYRIVSATAQDAIFTIDEQSTITFCNPAVERTFGYKPEELIGRNLEVIIPERFREAHHRGIERYLRTRMPNIPWTGVELAALHKDGHEFPCELSFGQWTGGEQTIFTGFARDVTERKRALETEKQAREQLQRRADEESSFRHLASALTGAVEMTEVLYEITLTTIALSADLLRDSEPEEQPELIDTIRNSARQMQRLIRDLLDVARVETGGLAVATTVIDPETLVREVCAQHEPLAEHKNVRLACELRTPLPRICADHDRLVQVLGNLIGNAVKFTPERGAITIEAKKRDGQVHFVVRDTGPGIPEADLKNVFTPYWQAKKTAHLGAGLGLRKGAVTAVSS